MKILKIMKTWQYYAVLSLAWYSTLTSATGGEIATGSEDPLNMSLDALLNLKVETVSHVEESAQEAPGTVHVFTADTIRKRGYTSLSDLLKHVPGFAVYHGVLQQTAVVRGLAANDNEKYTLLINGVEVNQVNEPDMLNGPINLENVERVEVVVGPSSLFERANTLVATINLITKSIDGTEIISSIGTERTTALTINSGKQISDTANVTLSATVERRRGWDAWDAIRSAEYARSLEGSTITGESVDLDHFVVAKAELGDWTLNFSSRRRVFPELRLYDISLPTSVQNGEYSDEAHGGSVRYDYTLADNQIVFTEWSSYYKEQVRSTPTHDWQSVAQWDHGVELGYIADLKKHQVQVGLQGTYEDNFDSFFDGAGTNRQYFYERDTSGIGAYVSDKYTVTERLKILAGVRADQNTLVGHDLHWGGRIGGSYHATDHWVTKLFANRANRMPSPLAALNEIWGINAVNPPPWATNSLPVDRPEVLTTLEWGNTLNYNKARFTATIYYQHLKHFITWGAPHTNVGEYKGWGIELTGDYGLNENLLLWANASYIRSRFHPDKAFGDFSASSKGHAVMDDEGRLLAAPMLTSTFGVDWRLSNRIHFSPNLDYRWNQPYKKTFNGGFGMVRHRAYVNTTFLYEVLPDENWDIRLTVKNLLNNREFVASPWQEGEYRPRGITVELSTSVRF